MARVSHMFRVFVSSTFSDLTTERDALQRRVFPAVRDHCAARGYLFQAIDLRWGIGEEASASQRTMRSCLDELALHAPAGLARCHPSVGTGGTGGRWVKQHEAVDVLAGAQMANLGVPLQADPLAHAAVGRLLDD